MTDEQPRRRSTDREIAQIDKRLGYIERDVDKLAKEHLPSLQTKLDGIREAMAEPEQSPLGRALLGRAVTNAENIARLDARLDVQEDWRSEMIGASRLARYIQIILGIIVALLTLVTLVDRTP